MVHSPSTISNACKVFNKFIMRSWYQKTISYKNKFKNLSFKAKNIFHVWKQTLCGGSIMPLPVEMRSVEKDFESEA